MISREAKLTLSVLLAAIIVLSFGIGYTFGRTTGTPGDTEYTAPPGVDIVGEAWDTILSEYVDRDNITTRDLQRGAIEGMLEVIDDIHSAYVEPASYELDYSSPLEGAFEGIGAYVGVSEDDELVIISPIPGSPAEAAGIRAGDIILEIDGEPVSGLSITDAVLKIRGPSGTAVSLLVLHKDEAEPVVIEIIRTTVELASLFFEMKGNIAYIQITQFSQRTDTELLPVLEDIIQQDARGIILDLRGNGGGILDTVVDVTSHFLSEGIVLQLADSEGVVSQERVTRGGTVITDIPLVVLVDESSASGSEVLAGALQDYDRAVIAGSTTYGKGSVNVLFRLRDGSGLYITIARWLTPLGRLIEGQGIEPDYALDVTGDEAVQWALDYLENSP